VKKSAKPNVVVSKCPGFAHCRYNGESIATPFVQKMVPHVNFIVVCPEVESGLGVPREFLRLVAVNGEPRRLQPNTGHDHTQQMQSFVASFLGGLTDVDGFILKNRSPLCGLNDVKVYASTKKGAAATKSQGMFGGAVMERFPNLAIEDEGRLNNFRIREHFSTRIYTLAAFRAVKAPGVMKNLVWFQAENKLLLMAYSQKELRALGKLVANSNKRPFDQVMADYEAHLHAALANPPRCGSHVNVLMHVLGYFSYDLSVREKPFSRTSCKDIATAKPLPALRAASSNHGSPGLARNTWSGRPTLRRTPKIF
jgi:uncharacterized protein YbbK (DUF523 family)